MVRVRSRAGRGLIALLTDFGIHNHYAGTMKGVVLGICPAATLVDLTHAIPPQDVLTGALELADACRYFPSGTIFLAVIDPAVGSARRAMAVEAGGYLFVAPDNGLLTVVLNETPPTRLVELSNPQYALPTVSSTFEGRDRFAPAAAWLAAGVDLGALGRPLVEWHRLAVPEPRASEGRIEGEVLRVDHFGNLITNIGRDLFDRVAAGSTDLEIVAGGHSARIVTTYAEAESGDLCALFGSTEQLEIAVNGGSAAARLAVGRGGPVTIDVLGFRVHGRACH